MKWKHNICRYGVYGVKPNSVEFKYGVLTMVSNVFLSGSPFIE